MENIYDIRKNEKLMYILQKETSTFVPTDEVLSSAAIAVYLYYEDTLELYFSYVNSVPEQIRIYIISSRRTVLDKALLHFQKRKNIVFLEKENRGRDISALLVSFREIALQYRYICFLHDKKAKHDRLEEDVAVWIKNLWDNTIASKEYIYNVLHLLEKYPDLGLLVPPELLGERVSSWYGDAWRDDFDNTVQLCNKLDLKCDVRKDRMPITLGTVFWAKTESLKKLFEKRWKYEDFHDEPLPESATISHAIERILGYVAQDAGYKTGTIMTTSYAEWSLLFVQEGIRKMHHILRNEMGIQTFYQIDCLEEQENRVREFFEKNKKVYIYGAGVYGKGLLKRIRQWGLLPEGYLVGKGRRATLMVDELKVYELGEIDANEDLGIVIAVNYNLQNEIEEDLKAAGFKNFIEGYI